MAVYRTTVGGSQLILFYKPPQATPDIRPEMNPNQFDYFWQTNTRTYPASRESLLKIFRNPDQRFKDGTSLRMVPKDGRGPCWPGHIPSIHDCISLSQEFTHLVDYNLETAKPDEVDSLFPTYLLHLLDPYPILNLTPPPFFLHDGNLRIQMGSFTDAVQAIMLPTAFPYVLHIMVFNQFANDQPKHQTAVIQTYNTSPAPQIPSLPPNSTLVCLNARDIARPSFIPNFNTVYGMYRPLIVILLEIRNTVTNLNEIVWMLPGNYRLAHSVLKGYAGGAALLWQPESVSGRPRLQSPAAQCLLDVNLVVKSLIKGPLISINYCIHFTDLQTLNIIRIDRDMQHDFGWVTWQGVTMKEMLCVWLTLLTLFTPGSHVTERLTVGLALVFKYVAASQ